MTYVLRLCSVEGRVVSPAPVCIGQFLASFDVEAHDGRGEAQFTADINRAMYFSTHVAAFEAWNTRSRTRPTRADGKPNKPLTAFTMTVMPVPIEHW